MATSSKADNANERIPVAFIASAIGGHLLFGLAKR